MNYQEAMSHMEQIAKKGSILGLEPVRTLCELMGNPQEKIKVIHIAGTNGKGSTLAYLESMLLEGGYKVGKYSSPTLFSYLERFTINKEMMSEEDFARYFSRAYECIKRMEERKLSLPTAFEVETAIAFSYFEQEKVDVVLLETGMGGETDATNIVTYPLCTVITSVDMDHMAVLGTSLKEIATKKAGIIKEQVPVVLSPNQKEEVYEVVLNRAKEKAAPFYRAFMPAGKEVSLEKQSFLISDTLEECENVNLEKYQIQKIKNDTFCLDISKTRNFEEYEIPLLGTHQQENASTALTVMKVLENEFFLTPAQKKDGLKKTKWKARFEVIRKKPLVIRDGAHNENAALRLSQSLQKYFTKPEFIYIMGVLKDKEYEKIVDIMAPMTKLVYVITPKNERALPAEELKAVWEKHQKKVIIEHDAKEALKLALRAYENQTGILCFGSLSFMAELEGMDDER